MKLLLTLTLVAALGLHAAPPSKLTWEADWEAAQARAAEEGRLILLAIAMDHEGRCERLRKEVYSDRDFQALAGEAVCLIASGDLHRDGKDCPVYDGAKCRDHYELELAMRERLGLDSKTGFAAIPQHVWLGPDGGVLLSVPYELSVDEMRWCFWQARARQWPAEAGAIPEGARPPRRLLLGDVYTPGSDDGLGRGLRVEELEALIKELKGSMFGNNRVGNMRKILFTDEADAVDHARVELGSALLSWGDTRMLEAAIHMLGAWSPEDYHEVVAEFAREASPTVRGEVAVAFEQLGTPAALKTVKSGLSKEQEVEVEKNWLRALGACGYRDKGARKTLLSVVEKDKNDLLRRNALIALGSLEPDEAVRACLLDKARSATKPERLAAACAMGISRRPEWLDPLRELIEACEDETLRADFEAVAAVLEGADLATIEDQVRRAGQDQIERERFFFRKGRATRIPGEGG